MFDGLDVFVLAQARMRHAGARQAVIAANVANADTPGYLSRDMPAFGEIMAAAGRDGPLGARLDRALDGMQPRATSGPRSPDGNGVTVEDEMVRAITVGRDHQRALNVYRTAMGLLRTAMGR